MWPRHKLDKLPNLRDQDSDFHGQCVAWRIFRDERSRCLPSLEHVVVKLAAGSCGDAWQLKKPIKLTKAEFDGWKARLWTGEHQHIRLLNIPITNKLIDEKAQDQYSGMVRDRVRGFYNVASDHPVRIYSASANVTPHSSVTEIHHDGHPYVSTAIGQSSADNGSPLKLWIIWKASENDGLSTCYSNTISALDGLGPCGFLIQYSGESILLPANVPHAVITLRSSILYGSAFSVQGRANDPTSFALEFSAGVKPQRAIELVAGCYEEGLLDPNFQVRMIHIKHLYSTILKDRMIMRKFGKGAYVNRVIEIARNCGKFEGRCTFCLFAGIERDLEGDCWPEHGLDHLRDASPQHQMVAVTESSYRKRRRTEKN